MHASDLLRHLLAIVEGISADVACLSLLFFSGQALLARFPGWRGAQRAPGPAGFDAFPAILMAALYCVWCWYGIKLGINLKPLTWGFCGLALACMVFTWRQLSATVPRITTAATLGWLFAFAAFYIVAYSFFTPNVSGAELPVVSYPNNDMMNYLNFSRALQDIRRSNVAGLSFVASPQYAQTPAAFYLIGLLATFFRMEPMQAAMPALFGLCALIALAAAWISRATFSVSRLWAFAIGATLISGPFFRYIAGNYFLSTLIGLPIVLHLIHETITFSPAAGRSVLEYAARSSAHYVLLLLTYPVLLVIALTVQGALLGVGVVTQLARRNNGMRAGPGGKQIAAVLLGVALMIAAVPRHVVTSVETVRSQSHAQAGDAGWPLGLISPLALLGYPGAVDDLENARVEHPQVALVAVAALTLVLVFGYFWWFRSSTTRAERLWVGVATASVFLYWAAFRILGPSYQQWKLASYLPLPFSFVLFAGTIRLAALMTQAVARRPSRLQRLGVLFPVAMAVFFVGGNERVHAGPDEPPLRRFPAALANLAEIDGQTSFRDLYVEMGGVGATFIPVYFIRHKVLHLTTPSYYPMEQLSLDRVSRVWPYFTQNFDCDAVGHSNTKTIAGVGCLLFDAPSPALDTPYPFSRNYMFITPLSGFAPRESWGRWNDGRLAQFEVSADAQRTPLDGHLYLNLQLRPYIPPKASHQRLVFSWGGREGSVDLAAQDWVSVPIDARQWKGVRVRTVTIALDLPDAVAPATVENSPEQRPLAVGFLGLELSAAARGHLVR